MTTPLTAPSIFGALEIDGVQYVRAEDCAAYVQRLMDAAALAKSPAPDEREAFELANSVPAGVHWHEMSAFYCGSEHPNADIAAVWLRVGVNYNERWKGWQSRSLQDRPVQPSDVHGISRVYQICNRYESGYGHGLKRDGLDLSKTPHGDAEMGEAYQIGYEAGEERAAQGEAVQPEQAEHIATLEHVVDECGKLTDWANEAGKAMQTIMDAYERRIRSLCADASEIEKEPWRCAEYIAAEQVVRNKPTWSITLQGATVQPSDTELLQAYSGALNHECSISSNMLVGLRAVFNLRPQQPSEDRPASLDKYNELLYAVSKVHPGETRHQTALRYIQERETSSDNRAGSTLKSEAGKGAGA